MNLMLNALMDWFVYLENVRWVRMVAEEEVQNYVGNGVYLQLAEHLGFAIPPPIHVILNIIQHTLLQEVP